eukprot:828997-Pyramimonas_sp.AAC.1
MPQDRGHGGSMWFVEETMSEGAAQRIQRLRPVQPLRGPGREPSASALEVQLQQWPDPAHRVRRPAPAGHRPMQHGRSVLVARHPACTMDASLPSP